MRDIETRLATAGKKRDAKPDTKQDILKIHVDIVEFMFKRKTGDRPTNRAGSGEAPLRSIAYQ